MKKRKIFVFLGFRGNFMVLNPVLHRIKKSDNLELILCVGASAILDKYGSIIDLVKNQGFEINETLYMLVEGGNPETMAKSTGLGIIELAGTIMKTKPDLTLLVGDRFEMLSTAITSAFLNIPSAHIMGGEVSGSIDESIRHAISKLTQIHFPANNLARQRLLQMGENEEFVFNFGCPRIDTVKNILKNPKKKEEMNKYISKEGVGDIFDIDNKFLVVSQHPVTTEYGKGKFQILETLKAVKEISEELDYPVIVLWPNADAGSNDVSTGIRIFREQNQDKNFHFFKNLPFEYYINLLNNSSCLVGNTSSGIREGSFIGTPFVNVGSRQDGRARGKNVLDVNYDHHEIKKGIEKQLDHGKYEREYVYGDGNASEKIIKVLETIEVNVQKKFISRRFN